LILTKGLNSRFVKRGTRKSATNPWARSASFSDE
jgi:hypothetical protein